MKNHLYKHLKGKKEKETNKHITCTGNILYTQTTASPAHIHVHVETYRLRLSLSSAQGMYIQCNTRSQKDRRLKCLTPTCTGLGHSWPWVHVRGQHGFNLQIKNNNNLIFSLSWSSFKSSFLRNPVKNTPWIQPYLTQYWASQFSTHTIVQSKGNQRHFLHNDHERPAIIE